MVDNGNLITKHSDFFENYGSAITKPYKAKKFREFRIPSPNPVNRSKLIMEVSYDPEQNVSSVKIMGSWRKWFYSSGTTRDLTRKDYFECIRKIARSVDLPFASIYNGHFSRLELGINVWYKENMGGILNGIISFKGFDRIYKFERQSVKYDGANYGVLFYDKCAEIMNNKEKNAKGDEVRRIKAGEKIEKRKSKMDLLEKMNKAHFCLRFEIEIKDKLYPPPELKYMIRSPKEIYVNWNSILDGMSNVFENASFAKHNLNVGVEFLKGKGLKELNMYETHVTAIAAGGVDNYVDILMAQLNDNHRKENIKNKLKILNSPPPELREALKSCELKTELLLSGKNNRIQKLKFKK